jgi:hypothetical protein
MVEAAVPLSKLARSAAGHRGVERLRVFDVQRFCIHDGPGIRSVVFLR